MERPVHTLSDLFRQLGLPDQPADIEQFIHRHRPLAPEVALADALIRTSAQPMRATPSVADDLWLRARQQLGMAEQARVDTALADALLRALEKSPDDRYPTCKEFAEALLTAAGAKPKPRPKPMHGKDRPRKK